MINSSHIFECNLCGKPFQWFPYRCRKCKIAHCSSVCLLEHELGCEVDGN